MKAAGIPKPTTSSARLDGYDVERIRADFPILNQRINGNPLVYLDNAATTQKPQFVIDALQQYYTTGNSNVHRGVHSLSQSATAKYEQARSKVRQFVNATAENEIIFVKGTTEAINLVAQCYVRPMLKAGDQIIISTLEHHSNIVPWQIFCEQAEAELRVIPCSDAGELLLDEYQEMLGKRTRFVAVGHVSNALGTINPVGRIVEMAPAHGAAVLIDGAQAVPHLNVDVQELDCDFYAFSGHKAYGPMGVGVLYGKAELLGSMPPYQAGGDMISSVTFEKTTYNELPYKFEAGTPNVAGVVGLGAAIDYIDQIGIDAISAYEKDLLLDATARLEEIAELRILGTAHPKAAVVSFVLDSIHPHDIGTILDQEGVAIRTGHHCAQPLMERFNVPATARASFGVYNTSAEIDALVEALRRAKEVFA